MSYHIQLFRTETKEREQKLNYEDFFDKGLLNLQTRKSL